MTKIDVAPKTGPRFPMQVDRIPVAGDYLSPTPNTLFRVRAIVMLPVSAAYAATVFVDLDPDGKADEL